MEKRGKDFWGLSGRGTGVRSLEKEAAKKKAAKRLGGISQYQSSQSRIRENPPAIGKDKKKPRQEKHAIPWEKKGMGGRRLLGGVEACGFSGHRFAMRRAGSHLVKTLS